MRERERPEGAGTSASWSAPRAGPERARERETKGHCPAEGEAVVYTPSKVPPFDGEQPYLNL